MDQWQLAKKLYDAGYSHNEVRRVWGYVWNEQRVGDASRRRSKRWEVKALDEIKVSVQEVEFNDASRYGDVSWLFLPAE